MILHSALEEIVHRRLRGYKEEPTRIQEDAGGEEAVLAGAYGYRQILELVQNGADAFLELKPDEQTDQVCGRIAVLLRGSKLYVANTGAPLSEEGLNAILGSHVSGKRGAQIGRFGLGFKSLLKFEGCIDLFTSVGGDIRFDPKRCKEELCKEFYIERAPGLRLAWPLPHGERLSDPVLGKLTWAETIIRVEIGTERLVRHVRDEIKKFPSEFLLFFPRTLTLTLDDEEDAVRELRRSVEHDETKLIDGDHVSAWRLFEANVKITDQDAINDATHIHARSSVPISWAVPIEGRREESGRFWAFFPTKTQTYIPGILNAPWKLNSDRNAIIDGEWNKVLMLEAAKLVAGALPSLTSAEDPARSLDAFPRQLERKDEDAAPLVEALWTLLESAEVIPDGTGTLRQAQRLERHPIDDQSLASSWCQLADEQLNRLVVHDSCYLRQRGSRLKALADRLTQKQDASSTNLEPMRLEEWFNHVASTAPDAALKVLGLAETYRDKCGNKDWYWVRELLKIIPTQKGTLEIPKRVILAREGAPAPDLLPIADEILRVKDAERILKDVMGLRELDDKVWTTELSDLQTSNPARFWELLRRAPAEVRSAFVRDHRDSVKVRRRDGHWVRFDQTLLPGPIVSEFDADANKKILIDDEFHSEDQAVLLDLGVSSILDGQIGPSSYHELPRKRLIDEWLEACRKSYREEYKNSASTNYLEPKSLSMPLGYSLLTELEGASRVRLTMLLLGQLVEGLYVTPVSFGHATNNRYPDIKVQHPLAWFVLHNGSVELGTQTVPLRVIVERRDLSFLKRLPDWLKIERALEYLCDPFPGVAVSSSQIRCFWERVFEALASQRQVAENEREEIWNAAARDGSVPSEVTFADGPISIREVYVTSSHELAHRARASELNVVVLDLLALDLWVSAGAQELSKILKPSWDSLDGTPERLHNVFPEVESILHEDWKARAVCRRVNGLQLRIGERSTPTPCLMWDRTLIIDAGQLMVLSRTERLKLLVTEADSAGWLQYQLNEALKRLGDEGVDRRRAEVARGHTLADRLLRAIGNRVEPLLACLGSPVQNLELVRNSSPLQIAELVLGQRGPAALIELRDAMKEEGLEPPKRWGTADARTFVESIGFPAEFAASRDFRRDPELMVSGPIDLPPLHDFQDEVFEALNLLLQSSTARRRAVVSLPTGGGKTRVTVEAAVRLVLRPEGSSRTALWIAQTDELCEQAVQAFQQVWVNHGAPHTSLRIARLWGGNPNPTRPQENEPVVVVASIQTLNNRFGTSDLGWLEKPGVVVIDECHHAITPSYTRLLRWLDSEVSRANEDQPKEEPPIIGLSATPFRTDDEESIRLARRFDRRWLPADQEQLHERLRRRGVLSRASYEPLESGASLTGDELARLEQTTTWEGLDFENLLESINQRLGGDHRRSELLTDFIRTSQERSILFFANSVAHAEEMAARLNVVGVGAAAVSGETPTAARRYFLKRFQNGEIKVLCNHSVLTTGFDAPKTDMVLIARQVFSPVRYMQMVGRGLRGELNGGTAECRIVTVMDNLGRFQDRHPYHYCRDFYSHAHI